MKFGAVLDQQSVPEWSLHNIDYNDLKRRIKIRTSKIDKSISIPGTTQPDKTADLEDELYDLLRCEHERAGRFVSCKLGECHRRLEHQKNVLAKAQQPRTSTPRSLLKQLKRLTAAENAILRVGQDLQDLCRFIAANRLAIIKLLKKYRKWTGTSGLESRVRRDFFEQPECFTRRNVKKLQNDQSNLLAETRTVISKIPESSSTEQSSAGSIPSIEQPLDPDSQAAREQKATLQAEPEAMQPSYWNEYEFGSEAGDEEPYTINFYPEQHSPFPGSATLAKFGRFLSNSFRSPSTTQLPPTDPIIDEETALLRPQTGRSTPSDDTLTEAGAGASSPPHILIQAPTRIGTNSSSKILRPSVRGRPPRSRYYSNFPRYSYYPPSAEQSAYRTKLLARASAACFLVAALVLALIGVFAASGRRKAAVRVYAATLVGVGGCLLLALAGLGCHLARGREVVRCSERVAVGLVFGGVCAGGGVVISGLLGGA